MYAQHIAVGRNVRSYSYIEVCMAFIMDFDIVWSRAYLCEQFQTPKIGSDSWRLENVPTEMLNSYNFKDTEMTNLNNAALMFDIQLNVFRMGQEIQVKCAVV